MTLAPTGFKADRHDLVTVSPGNPAAGANLVWPCPNNRVIQVVSVALTYTTDATVANRLISLELLDAVVPLSSPALVVQPANLPWFYWWAIGSCNINHSATNLSLFNNLSDGFFLKTGESLQTAGASFLDQIAACRIRYYEWNED